MGAYSASGTNTLAATPDTALTIAANAAIPNRNAIYDVMVGVNGGATPADVMLLYTLQRCTALGTNTAVVPTKLDPADRVAGALCGENHTVEPTYTSAEEVLELPVFHRGTMRWVAAPGSEILTPATAASGVGLWAGHATDVSDYRTTILWRE